MGRLAGGEKDTCIIWTAHLLARIAHSTDPPAVSSTLALLTGKAGIETAVNAIDLARDPAHPPERWLADLVDLAASECLRLIAEDLTMEPKPPERRLRTLVQFVEEAGRLSEAIELVRDGLVKRRWTVGDVAAIYVEFEYQPGSARGDLRLNGFDQQGFLRLVPVDTVWDHRGQAGPEDGSRQRYGVAEPVDRNDTSLDNLVRAGLNGVRMVLHVEAKHREADLTDDDARPTPENPSVDAPRL